MIRNNPRSSLKGLVKHSDTHILENNARSQGARNKVTLTHYRASIDLSTSKVLNTYLLKECMNDP